MSEISRAALFGKLNALAYKAIESATVFCKMRGNPYVELEHWFAQLLQNQESDLHRIVQHYGLDIGALAKDVTTRQSYHWEAGLWDWPGDFAPQKQARPFKVVALDYGAKRNILRSLVAVGADVTVLPATATAEEVLAHNPEGVFLSNGPGDPAATGTYAVPMIRTLLDHDLPIFGICLGHQMLALALGAKTVKMGHGHHGANHPVRDIDTGKVEITSMNHGFAVDAQTLPEGVRETHVSLFDGSNCGLAVDGRPVFSVQYHPEASPGPQDSAYLFDRFAEQMRNRRAG